MFCAASFQGVSKKTTKTQRAQRSEKIFVSLCLCGKHTAMTLKLESQWRDRLTVYGYLAYFLLTIALLLPYVNSYYGHVDEMLLLADAKRVLMGEHQHRDFFSFYGGANFYLVVLIWKIIGGVSVSAIKLATFIATTLGGLLLIVITRRFTRRFWLTLVPALFFANYLVQIFPYSNHHWFGSVASMLFLFFLVRYLLGLRPLDLYICGIANGISLIFLTHEGVVNFITALVMMAAVALLLKREINLYNPVKLLLTYLGGLFTIMLPVIIFYLSTGAFHNYIYDTFIWAFGNYARKGNINDLPWVFDLRVWINWFYKGIHPIFSLNMGLVLALLLLPPAVFAVVAGLLTGPDTLTRYFQVEPSQTLAARLATAGKAATQRHAYLVLFVLIVFAAGIYATAVFSRPGVLQLFWGTWPALIIAVIFFDRVLSASEDFKAIKRIVSGLLIAFLIVVNTVCFYKTAKVLREGEIDFETPQLSWLGNHSLLDLINKESNEQDYFFAYKFLNVLYYYVKARPATRYTGFVENYLTNSQVQELIQALYQKQPKFLVFNNDQDLLWFAGKNPDFPSWLNNNYSSRGYMEGVLVYQRKR
jgi:hypothetical protein